MQIRSVNGNHPNDITSNTKTDIKNYFIDSIEVDSHHSLASNPADDDDKDDDNAIWEDVTTLRSFCFILRPTERAL